MEKVEIQAAIESSIEIKNVYSPTHPIEVKRPGRQARRGQLRRQEPGAHERFPPVLRRGARASSGPACSATGPSENDDGYFLLLASPQIKAADAERPQKTVVCVFDRSGSMSGKKIEQAKEALKFVLNNLREGDLFNIIAYDSEVEAFRPELQRYNDETRKAGPRLRRGPLRRRQRRTSTGP